MKIAAIDDERLALEALVQEIMKACPDSELFSFRKTADLLAFIQTNEIELVFADFELRNINGLELATMLKAICPTTSILFVTGQMQLLPNDFLSNSAGYLMKPATADKILHALEDLRNPAPSEMQSGKLQVQTFGNFQAYHANEPIPLKLEVKELLAYLIDKRGALCPIGELSAMLWPGESSGHSKTRHLLSCAAELKRTLGNAGFKNVIVKKQGGIAVNVTSLDCDYYKFLQGDVRAINAFKNNYLPDYAWAKFTLGSLAKL